MKTKKVLMMVELEDHNDYPQDDLFDYFRYLLTNDAPYPAEVDLSAIDVKGVRLFNVDAS